MSIQLLFCYMSNSKTEDILLQNSQQRIKQHEGKLNDLIIEYEGLLEMVLPYLSKYMCRKIY